MTDNYRSDGVSLSESDMYLRLVDELKICRDLCRGLGHSRKDARYLKVASTFEQISETVKKLYTKRTGVYIGRG